MILLVLVALVARVDATPGEAEGAQPVRDAKLLTRADAANDRQSDQADDANLADELDDDDDAEVADDVADDDAEVADDVADDGWGATPEDAREDDPGALDPGNPDPRDLDPSDPRTSERLVFGADDDRADRGDRGDLADGDGASDDDAGQLAMREAEQAPAGTSPDDDANAAASPAGALETYEAWIRHPRLSRLGRLDVSLAWRQLWSEPMHTIPHRADEVWLVATWRR